jgi:hypothetical protein
VAQQLLREVITPHYICFSAVSIPFYRNERETEDEILYLFSSLE